MRKFSIQIRRGLRIYYSHYLSDKFIKEKGCHGYFKEGYPLLYFSRGFDKPAVKDDGACFWYLDNKRHRVGKPALICSDGSVAYWENGKKSKVRKFSIRIFGNLNICYDYYLSDKFIYRSLMKADYPLWYGSRKFDKPARKFKSGTYGWGLDNEWHRVGKPAWIYSDGGVVYYENGERVQ